MTQIITNIKQLALYAILLAGLGACNKDADVKKAVSIEMRGFNIGNSELEVSIDTLVFAKDKIPANREVNFRRVFTYPASLSEVSFKIKDLSSGKEVYQQKIQLNNGELELYLPFVFIDGKQLEIKPPAPDPATNKMGFYIHYPASNDLIDVFMQNDEGQIAYLAKNVTPSTWVYADYAGHEGFNDPNTNYTLYFTKAGTTDVWAFNDNQYMSLSHEDALVIPQNGQKGRVCSYFITPGSNDLRTVRLFRQPK